MLKNNPYMKSYLNIIKESVIDDINIEKKKHIAERIGGTYNIKTNTINCKGHKFTLTDRDLNNDRTFDFKIINASDDWSNAFEDCYLLTHLPEDFVLPDTTTDCSSMFYNCEKLKYLPEHFTIPQQVESCCLMFSGCQSLITLPEHFTIPQSVTDCFGMFLVYKLRQ